MLLALSGFIIGQILLDGKCQEWYVVDARRKKLRNKFRRGDFYETTFMETIGG
jgi:hypothetical protein